MARYVLNANGFPVGSVSEIKDGPEKGFRFIPMVQRSPSRKSWPTPEAALPRDFRKTCRIVEAPTLDEAIRLGGVWRSKGLVAMRAEMGVEYPGVTDLQDLARARGVEVTITLERGGYACLFAPDPKAGHHAPTYYSTMGYRDVAVKIEQRASARRMS